jgi:hypothetical protein
MVVAFLVWQQTVAEYAAGRVDPLRRIGACKSL